MEYQSKYLPVDPDFYDVIAGEKLKNKPMQVYFFEPGNQVQNIKGIMNRVVTDSQGAEFLELEGNRLIRLDRIIVLNGRPGPAYDEYDSYALACLDCTGGMD